MTPEETVKKEADRQMQQVHTNTYIPTTFIDISRLPPEIQKQIQAKETDPSFISGTIRKEDQRYYLTKYGRSTKESEIKSSIDNYRKGVHSFYKPAFFRIAAILKIL